MSRYEPFDPQEHREPAASSETGRERKPEDNSPTAGRGGSSAVEQTDSRDRTDGERNKEARPRHKHRDRDRTYNLRDSEIRTLVEIGRTVGDDYSMLKKNVTFRKQIANKIGVGFELPESISAPVIPNIPKTTVVQMQQAVA